VPAGHGRPCADERSRRLSGLLVPDRGSRGDDQLSALRLRKGNGLAFEPKTPQLYRTRPVGADEARNWGRVAQMSMGAAMSSAMAAEYVAIGKTSPAESPSREEARRLPGARRRFGVQRFTVELARPVRIGLRSCSNTIDAICALADSSGHCHQ